MGIAAQDIRAAVRNRFAKIATAPDQETKFPVGPESAKALGYDPQQIDRLPRAVTTSFAGVGNPLSLGRLDPGQVVLDLGSGAGLDSILAARSIMPSGTVIGVDLAEEMAKKARSSVQSLALDNVELFVGAIEELPLPDRAAHLAISNGVFNLCPDKPRVLVEAHRVLRPGGWLLMADILLEDAITPEEVARLGTWSD